MKKLLTLMLTAGLLAACGNDSAESEQLKEKAAKVETKKEEPTKEVSKEEPTKTEEPQVELSESKVSFTNYTVEIEKAEVKDGKLLLKTRFTNDSFQEPKSMMAAGSLDVKQGGKLLDEVTGVQADPKSNYYYKNKTGINAPVEFEYELVNETDPVEITFVSSDWNEDSKTIAVTLQ